MDKKKLTDKQRTFCEEYMIDLNATQAAIRAGYSEKTAKDIACENLAKPNIQEYLAELKGKRSDKLEIDSTKVLQELLNWAYGDTTEIMLLSPEKIKALPIEKRRLITGYKYHYNVKQTDKNGAHTYHTLVEPSFISKEKAMEMITKHIGFNELDNMQQNKDNAPQINISVEGKRIDLSM